MPWLALIAAVLGILLYLVQDAIRVKEVIVVGNEVHSAEAVIGMVGIEEGDNILEVYFNQHEHLEELAFLEKAEVIFVSYNQVRIEVVEKEVVAGYRHLGQYLCIDKDGYIISQVEALPEGVPLIKGADVEGFAAGQPLAMETAMLDALLSFHQLQKKYGFTLDTINFRHGGDSDILLGKGSLLFYIGSAKDLEAKMERISKILGKISDETRGYIDLTDPQGRMILKKFGEN